MYLILRVVDSLKTILTAILAYTAQKLHECLGYQGQPLGSASLGLARDRQGRLFGTQHLVEYQEEASLDGVRSHRALTYDHSGAIGYTLATLPSAPLGTGSAGLGEE